MLTTEATGRFLLVASLFWAGVFSAHCAVKTRPAKDVTTQYWVDAFTFFQSENDATSLDALRTKALEKQYGNIHIVKKVLDSVILLKDRSLLNETVLTLAQKNDCLGGPSSSSAHMCAELRTLWTKNLDSLYFYEESAGKAEHARRFLESKECDKALSVLKELELKEGSIVPQVDYSRRAYDCLGDDGNRVSKEAELKKLKIFDNY